MPSERKRTRDDRDTVRSGASGLLDDNDGNDVGFTINKKFAEKYELKKQREDFTTLKAKYNRFGGDDKDSDTSTEEDEEAELLTAPVDAQIMRTIAMIRKRDPAVYDPTKNFFDKEELKKTEEDWSKHTSGANTTESSVTLAEKSTRESAKSGIKLKDWHRQNILAGEYLKDDTENTGLTFVEEQNELKKQITAEISNQFDANGESAADSDEDDFLTLRKDESGNSGEDGYRTFLMGSASFEEGLAQKEPESKDEAFLMNYILNRGWIDRDMGASKGYIPRYNDIVGNHNTEEIAELPPMELEDEEEIVEEQERFEKQYNFRFEEEGATEIATHARDNPLSMRRKDTRRKEERDRKKKAKELKEKQEEEERRRLANLQRKEYEKRLERIKKVAGLSGDVELDEKIVMDADFDPDEWKRQVEAKFGDDYYNNKEADWDPTMDDDIDIGDIVGNDWDTDAVKPAVDDSFAPETEHNETAEGTAVDEDLKPRKLTKGEKKMMRKKGIPIPRDGMYHPNGESFDRFGNSISKELQEFFKTPENLEAEKSGSFHYRQVEPENYGLTPEEILLAPESLLNEFVSLKKMTPYRPEHKVEKDKKTWKKSGKYRVKEFRKKLAEYLEDPDKWEAAEREKRKKKRDAERQTSLI